MAKGLRSSVKKNNRTKLRSRVFGPVEDARTERLHAKLLETIAQPKPEQPAKKEMDIDSAEELKDKEDDMPKDMEIDNGAAATTAPTSKAPKKKINKSKLKAKTKPRNQMTFPKKPSKSNRVTKRR